MNVAITDKAMCKQGIIFMKPAGEPPCTNLGAALAWHTPQTWPADFNLWTSTEQCEVTDANGKSKRAPFSQVLDGNALRALHGCSTPTGPLADGIALHHGVAGLVQASVRAEVQPS